MTNDFDNWKIRAGEWYYRNKIDNRTEIYSLLNANTRKDIDNRNAVVIKQFKECLKGSRDNYMVILLSYLKNFLSISDGIDYWGIYPASGKNDGIDTQGYDPILVRTVSIDKRHNKLPYVRIKEGCDNQFCSVVLNDCYRDRLRGASVGIIDDYSTYGTSCETARHLFGQAGVDSLVFITVGKYGSDYYRYEYDITGDVYSDYGFQRMGKPKNIKGEMSDNPPDRLIEYLNRYKENDE